MNDLMRVHEVYDLHLNEQLISYNRIRNEWRRIDQIQQLCIGYSIFDDSPQYEYIITYMDLDHEVYQPNQTLKIGLLR